MSNPEDITAKTRPPAQTGAQRQAALRARRLKEGRREVSMWLTAAELAKVNALLTRDVVDAAECDALAGRLEKVRALNLDLIDDVSRYHGEVVAQEKTIQELRLQLQQATNALKEKPAKTFVVPQLPNRRSVIAKAFSFETGWRGVEEMSASKLKAQAELARKFSTDIKQARSRLAGLVSVLAGASLVEQSKTKAVFGSWNKFDPPIVSPAEKSLLSEACVVLGSIERDVERAGSDVEKLHKQREAEDAARWKSAVAVLDSALFNGLDRRGEVLFVVASLGHRASVGSDWDDLLDAVNGRGYRRLDAAEAFRRAFVEAKGKAVRHVADAMKSGDKKPEELAAEIADKFRHPDTREKHGQLADQVAAFLVSERLSRA